METIALGRTELPLELILDYLDSLKEVYTPESYDLFLHNCNNLYDIQIYDGLNLT
jgi:desumoylating isopeptidase 1